MGGRATFEFNITPDVANRIQDGDWAAFSDIELMELAVPAVPDEVFDVPAGVPVEVEAFIRSNSKKALKELFNDKKLNRIIDQNWREIYNNFSRFYLGLVREKLKETLGNKQKLSRWKIVVNLYNRSLEDLRNCLCGVALFDFYISIDVEEDILEAWMQDSRSLDDPRRPFDPKNPFNSNEEGSVATMLQRPDARSEEGVMRILRRIFSRKRALALYLRIFDCLEMDELEGNEELIKEQDDD